MNDAARLVMENLAAYAKAYTAAYKAMIAAGAPLETAQTEARLLGFLAVSPEATTPPAGIPGFGPREGSA